MNFPSNKIRYAFWLILGAVSAAFAEVPTGSDIFIFSHPAGIFITYPLYMLHVLVLGRLVFAYGKGNFAGLYAAGMLVGMSEAYITKVLWNPPWGPPLFSVGGVAGPELIVLVFGVHPLLAMIVPVVLCELFLTSSANSFYSLPVAVRLRLKTDKRLWFGVAAAMGLMQGSNTASPGKALVSGLFMTIFFSLVLSLWNEITEGQRPALVDLLPNKREWRFLAAGLAVFYVVLTFAARPEAIPRLGPQAVVWVIYAGLIFLFLRSFRMARPPAEPPPIPACLDGKTAAGLMAVFIAASAAASCLPPFIKGIFLWLSWVVFALIGLRMFAHVLAELVGWPKRKIDTASVR